jgi:hypothetical protein
MNTSGRSFPGAGLGGTEDRNPLSSRRFESVAMSYSSGFHLHDSNRKTYRCRMQLGTYHFSRRPAISIFFGDETDKIHCAEDRFLFFLAPIQKRIAPGGQRFSVQRIGDELATRKPT